MKNYLFLSTLSLISSVMGEFTASDSVVILNTGNFKKKVLNNKGVTLVKFYAPWCGHCKQFEPTYKKVAKDLEGVATIAAIDCDNEANKPICGQYEVQGFPTVKLFKGKLTSKPGDKPLDYNGPRTKKAVKSFVTNAIPNKVLKITEKAKAATETSSKLEDFIQITQSSGQHRSLLFSNKGKISPIYKSLALTFTNKIKFGQINSDQSDYVDQYSIESFPTLIVEIDFEDEKLTKKFEGEFKPKELKEFYKSIVKEYPVKVKESESKTKKEKYKTKSKSKAKKIDEDEEL